MSDVNMLSEMGFDPERSAIALKHGGNLQGAIDWLEKNQDKSLEELKNPAASTEEEGPPLQPGEEARSLVCNECGKKFRSQAQAEFHASKTEHTDFAESTEEIAPLTEAEKQARLQDLREKLAAKRAGNSEQEKADRKRNEEIRRKATKEQSDAKEELAKKQQIKEAQAKQREKQADIDAKKRIKDKIEQDKLARKEKADREKAQREGRQGAVEESAPKAPTQPKPTSAYTETRLRLQTPSGTLQNSFPVEMTLFEVVQWIQQQNGTAVTKIQMNFPKKAYTNEDYGMTLKEAGMVPSAALVVS